MSEVITELDGLTSKTLNSQRSKIASKAHELKRKFFSQNPKSNANPNKVWGNIVKHLNAGGTIPKSKDALKGIALGGLGSSKGKLLGASDTNRKKRKKRKSTNGETKKRKKYKSSPSSVSAIRRTFKDPLQVMHEQGISRYILPIRKSPSITFSQKELPGFLEYIFTAFMTGMQTTYESYKLRYKELGAAWLNEILQPFLAKKTADFPNIHTARAALSYAQSFEDSLLSAKDAKLPSKYVMFLMEVFDNYLWEALKLSKEGVLFFEFFMFR